MFFTADEDIELNTFLVNNAPLAMFALGFWDDLKRLGAITKLAWQLLIASTVTLCGVCIQCLDLPGFAGIIDETGWEIMITIAWLVTCTNAVNLVDGVDGLAASISLILMGLMVCVAQGAQVCLTAGMIGALLAFLLFNFPPARVYLGDGGAYFIGFQLGLWSTIASQRGCAPGPLSLVLFGLTLPLLDTALALARRGLRGLPLFRPDRNHLHHCLLETGMSPRRLVLCYCGFTAILALAGWFLTIRPQTFFVPVTVGIALVLAVCLWQLLLRLGGWQTLNRAFKSSVAMRKEIAYALCLRTWLKHEAVRCSSVEELYADLKLAARRLGFTSVQLALADGTRRWKQPSVCGPLLTTRHCLQGGTLGVLELEAPRCRLCLLKRTWSSATENRCGESCQPLFNDARLVRILSELLAESWIEATRDWRPGKARLRFDHELAPILGVARRSLPANSVQPIDAGPALQAKRRVTATTRRFFSRAVGFRLCAALLVGHIATGRSASVLLQESFAEIPRPEIPAKAASLVRNSSLSARAEMTSAVVRAAGKVSPAVVPAVVAAIAKTTPEAASLAAGQAALDQPAQACVIARAAAESAPAEFRAIVLAVGRAVPNRHRDVVLSVEQAVPGSNKQNVEALVAAAQELRGTNSASVRTNASLSGALDNPGSLPPPRPELIRHGVRAAYRDPLARGHALGPPFVPLSGTVTNISQSTSGTVGPGRRNYAKP
jgi:UDP-GlcNAc:undecaprenyl-phosphate GlcNAc-1-phosphate transferase